MADAHTYKFKVAMSCGGCSGAINRVLGKLEGASLPRQLMSISQLPRPVYSTHITTMHHLELPLPTPHLS